MKNVIPSTRLDELGGIFSRFLPKLKKIRVETVGDLLRHFPIRYEDFSKIYHIADIEPGMHVTIRGTLELVNSRRTWQKRMNVVEATIKDDSGTLRAVWFNQPYLARTLRPGQTIHLAGKVAQSDSGELHLAHPTHEIIRKASDASPPDTRHTGRIVGIYPETRGFTSRGIRYLITPLLENVEFHEWIPENILSTHRFPEQKYAFPAIHFPRSMKEAERARRRFEFEDLFLLQLANLRNRARRASVPAPVIETDIPWLKRMLRGLPFTLTESQKRTLWDVIKDMSRPHPMNRLVQGDVGSGKTVVAALAALIAAKEHFQAAFMAPTEVLARQHFHTLRELFKGIESTEQPAIGLLTSSESKILYETDVETETKKSKLISLIEKGDMPIVVGTHALIQNTVQFKNLGLVVVDEQHRFGVKQRALLLQRGKKSSLVPHLLSMSATPIPRTLMLTVFGDLDASLITELPGGRKKIITEIVPPQKRTRVYRFIEQKVAEGRQVFVICPRIAASASGGEPRPKGAGTHEEPSTWTDVKAVKEEHEKLSKKVFPNLTVEMLHGKMTGKEKERRMVDFHQGKIDILVSTSVVEVGVDVPNAVVMMIEGSERFGLAQLYQLRGRVGRGIHQSHCFLMTDSETKTAQTRLKAIVTAKNGFELAEHDLKLRGPGEFLGEAQTGFPDLAMKGLQNPELVRASREAAKDILEYDPELKAHALLEERLRAFEKSLHRE